MNPHVLADTRPSTWRVCRSATPTLVLRMNQMHSEREYIAVLSHVPEALSAIQSTHRVFFLDCGMDGMQPQ